MTLAKYLELKKLSYAAFGRECDLPRVTVRQYALGQRTRISEENLRRIVKATKGKVTANDFYGIGRGAVAA